MIFFSSISFPSLDPPQYKAKKKKNIENSFLLDNPFIDLYLSYSIHYTNQRKKNLIKMQETIFVHQYDRTQSIKYISNPYLAQCFISCPSFWSLIILETCKNKTIN